MSELVVVNSLSLLAHTLIALAILAYVLLRVRREASARPKRVPIPVSQRRIAVSPEEDLRCPTRVGFSHDFPSRAPPGRSPDAPGIPGDRLP